MKNGGPIVLGIESSCDDTAAAVLVNGEVRSNVVAGQQVHAQWGGVVPELASRAHQENIVPVVDRALEQAGVHVDDLDAVAFTQGPGLIGALLVGACFAKSLAQARGIPLLAVDHLRAHVLAHFIRDHSERPQPAFPFLNLTVSGGHTQLILVRSPHDMELVGSTLDDAAGETFDKGAKLLGLPYPGGPMIDRLAAEGDPSRHMLPIPAVPGCDMSFSGLKTAFANLVQDGERREPGFAARELRHLCAALQDTIVTIVVGKMRKAARSHRVEHVAISGGVSANSHLRERFRTMAGKEGWQAHVLPMDYCTDNAAMIAMAGTLLFREGLTSGLDVVPVVRA